MGTDTSMVAARGWGREMGNYGTKFQFCKKKSVLETDGGDGCMT